MTTFLAALPRASSPAAVNLGELVRDQVAETIEFALKRFDDEHLSKDERLQIAQDAWADLLVPLADFIEDAYRKTLAEADLRAIAVVFQKMAARARLIELLARADDEHLFVQIETLTRTHEGELQGVIEHEEEPSVWLIADGEDIYTPLKAVVDLHQMSDGR